MGTTCCCDDAQSRQNTSNYQKCSLVCGGATCCTPAACYLSSRGRTTERTKGVRWLSDDATRWVWIAFGLAQAIITTLMAFDVIEGTTLVEATTAIALILYVAVNELLVRPRRREN